MKLEALPLISVVITDDHPMVIQGLQSMLSHYPHISVKATFRSGAELLAHISDHLPDILLLDMQLSDATADDLVPGLMEKHPELKVMILTNFDSVLYATKMLYQGVRGYLLKTTDEPVLVQAIETVFAGKTFIEKELEQKLGVDPFRSRKVFTARSGLTTREKEVLQLIVNGDTDAEIAGILFLGLTTVKHYRMCILLKLDVKNTASLVGKALKLGLAK